MAEEKKRLRLQPSLPRIRRKREEQQEAEQAPADAPREQAPEQGQPQGHEQAEGGHASHLAPKHRAGKPEKPGRSWKRPFEGGRAAFKPHVMQDKKLLIGIVILIAVVIVVLIALWVYPLSQPKPQGTVSASQVRGEMARLEGMNAFPDNRNIDPADYPKDFGVYSKNGLTLTEIYYCSDVCPDYGAVHLVYKGVDNEACAGAGGKSVHDLAWGGYIGCEPRVG